MDARHWANSMKKLDRYELVNDGKGSGKCRTAEILNRIAGVFQNVSFSYTSFYVSGETDVCVLYRDGVYP